MFWAKHYKIMSKEHFYKEDVEQVLAVIQSKFDCHLKSS